MVATGARLRVIDNSGVQLVQIIGILKKFKKRFGRMHDIFVVVLKRLKRISNLTKRKVKKGGLGYALLVASNAFIKRFGGSRLKGKTNDLVLITKELELVGKRVLGYVSYTYKERGFLKVLSSVYTVY